MCAEPGYEQSGQQSPATRAGHCSGVRRYGVDEHSSTRLSALPACARPTRSLETTARDRPRTRGRGGGYCHLPGSVAARRADAPWGVMRVSRMLVAVESLDSEHTRCARPERVPLRRPPPLPTPLRWRPRPGAPCRRKGTLALPPRLMYSNPSPTRRCAQRERAGPAAKGCHRAGTAAVTTPHLPRRRKPCRPHSCSACQQLELLPPTSFASTGFVQFSLESPVSSRAP